MKKNRWERRKQKERLANRQAHIRELTKKRVVNSGAYIPPRVVDISGILRGDIITSEGMLIPWRQVGVMEFSERLIEGHELLLSIPTAMMDIPSPAVKVGVYPLFTFVERRKKEDPFFIATSEEVCIFDQDKLVSNVSLYRDMIDKTGIIEEMLCREECHTQWSTLNYLIQAIYTLEERKKIKTVHVKLFPKHLQSKQVVDWIKEDLLIPVQLNAGTLYMIHALPEFQDFLKNFPHYRIPKFLLKCRKVFEEYESLIKQRESLTNLLESRKSRLGNMVSILASDLEKILFQE